MAPDGYSASLERISPLAKSDLPQNWASSPLSADPLKPGGTPGKQNANFSTNLPPIVTNLKATPANPVSDQPIIVETDVQDADGLREVNLRYRIAGPGFEKEELSVPMKAISDRRFSATIPGQKPNQIVRFRIQAIDQKGAQRLYPGEYEPRPALSRFVHDKFEPGKIPLGIIINVGESEFKVAEKHRKNPNTGGFSEENLTRWRARMMLESGMDLESAWFQVAARQQLAIDQVRKLQPIFSSKLSQREELIEKTVELPDLKDKLKTLPELVRSFQSDVKDTLKTALSAAENEKFVEWQQQQSAAAAGGPTRMEPEAVLKRFLNLEAGFFKLTARSNVTEAQFTKLKELYQSALEERSGLIKAVQAVMSGEGDREAVEEKIAAVDDGLAKKLKTVLTAEQDRQFTEWRKEKSSFIPGRGGPKTVQSPQGHSAFVYVNQQTGEPELFDFVNIPSRNAGYKVHFHKDRPLQGMSSINLIFEYNERFVMAEPLAYEVYRRAGNVAPQTDFVRLWIDGELVGYHLLIEQPNRAFLRRNKLKDDGNLYKMVWEGRGLVGQHEKKTNVKTGHEDLIELVDLLEKTKSKPDEQWALIKKHFNVEQVINYFAVNTCLSHWDGFFNNYLTYHDVNGTGKWEMYPWDQDKTWGFHDGIREGEVFYDMPLTFGMEGDVPPGWPKDRPPPRGFGGATPWWRAGGYFSRPLLANAHFRKHYLARTKEILDTIYTEEVFFPIIDSTGQRLEDEVKLRALAIKADPDKAAEKLQANLQSLREHLVKRRKFLLEQDELRSAGKFLRTELN
jgi:hypothetical protein